MAVGTREDPWELKTPPGTSSYTMYKDEQADPPALVCQVGSTTLKYRLRAVEDLHAWLKARGDWVPLGAADEKKPAADGTVEAWGRSADNPVGGWYGLRSGYRGRFGMYLPPLLEELGLAELTMTPATTGCGRPEDFQRRRLSPGRSRARPGTISSYGGLGASPGQEGLCGQAIASGETWSRRTRSSTVCATLPGAVIRTSFWPWAASCLLTSYSARTPALASWVTRVRSATSGTVPPRLTDNSRRAS